MAETNVASGFFAGQNFSSDILGMPCYCVVRLPIRSTRYRGYVWPCVALTRPSQGAGRAHQMQNQRSVALSEVWRMMTKRIGAQRRARSV